MAYSTDVVRRARARLAGAKEERESQYRQHLAEAYSQNPRLREIDIGLRRTMAMAAQAAFTQGGDVQAAMERAKNANLALQREREVLVAECFEEGYLDDSPICDICGGNGYIGSSMCECLQELCRQEQKKELSLLAGGGTTFSQFRLDYYSDRYDQKYGASPRTIMEKNLKDCHQYATMFTPGTGNLLFVGGTGLGKTFLSGCIARVVANRGYSVVYESAARMFAKLERAKFSGDEQARQETEKYSECDLLIIDDLGTEMPGQFVTAALYSLVNDRLLMGKALIVSTNLNVDEIAKRYSPQIASRFYGNFKRVTFVGEDIRIIMNRGY